MNDDVLKNISIVSDIHLDIHPNELTLEHLSPFISTENEYLVIAGDVSNDYRTTMKFVNRISKYYKKVFFVDGNHDWYRTKELHLSYEDLKSITCDKWNSNTWNMKEKIYYLYTGNKFSTYNRSFKINSTLFVGCNGWYNFEVRNQGVRKHEAIQDWSLHSIDNKSIFFDHNTPEVLARNQANHIKGYIERAQNNDSIENIVVITHTIPNEKVFDKFDKTHFYSGSKKSIYRNARSVNTFMNDAIKADKKHKIKYWICGHTHHRTRFFDEESKIEFVQNCYGTDSIHHSTFDIDFFINKYIF